MCSQPYLHLFVSDFFSFCFTLLMMLMFVMSDINNVAYRSDFDHFNFLEDELMLTEVTATTTITSDATYVTYVHPKWLEPYFDPATPRNITALMGKSAYLSCRVRNLGNKTVSWIRHRDIHILTVGSYTYTSDQRFQATHHPDSDDWTLQIKWAQKRDAGMYECQISTQPIRSYFVRLNVVVPTATILGGPDLHVDKGSTINLTCTVKFSPEPPAYIFWYHQEEVINYDSTRGGVSVITEKGDVTTSFLLIQNADLVDSGKYSCAPSNADVASVRVHVLNGEHPEAMQTGSSGCQFSRLTIVLLMTLVFYYYQQNMTTLIDELNTLNNMNGQQSSRRRSKNRNNRTISNTSNNNTTKLTTTTIIKSTMQHINNNNNNNNNRYDCKMADNKQQHKQQQQQQQQQQEQYTKIESIISPNSAINTININYNCCCHCDQHHHIRQQYQQDEQTKNQLKYQKVQQKEHQQQQQLYYQYPQRKDSNENNNNNNRTMIIKNQSKINNAVEEQHHQQYESIYYKSHQRLLTMTSHRLCPNNNYQTTDICYRCRSSYLCCCCCYNCYCCCCHDCYSRSLYAGEYSYSCSCSLSCSFTSSCYCSCNCCHYQYYTNYQHYHENYGYNCCHIKCCVNLQQQLLQHQQLHFTVPAQTFMPQDNNEKFLAVR